MDKVDKPEPSRLAIMAWGVALLIVPVTIWFGVAVAVPAYQVSQAIYRDRTELKVCSFGDPFGSRNVVRLLGGPEPAFRKLRAYLSLPRSLAAHREEAIWHLGRCGPRALPHIAELLKSKDPHTRVNAMVALEQTGSPRTLDLLEGMIHNPDVDCRCTAAVIVARHPLSTASYPLLVAVLQDEAEEVRECVFRERRNGVHGSDRQVSIALLRTMSEQKDERVRKVARFWLKCLGD